ncbi:MAG: hypothetical protein O2973_01580 [Gemmatimonadetes bacterium]|nr:hypothetical protein [Gemmatimonadota bacterium]
MSAASTGGALACRCIIRPMTWIKTIDPMTEGPVREATLAQAKLYPREYATTTNPSLRPEEKIGASHSLIPDVMRHAFSTFGAAMSPDLPLERRHHEMIATVVSVINRCRY